MPPRSRKPDVVCEPEGSCCRPAVARAYREMRDRGEPESYAFDAALVVFQWHHPGTDIDHARAIVGAWVSPDVRH